MNWLGSLSLFLLNFSEKVKEMDFNEFKFFNEF